LLRPKPRSSNVCYVGSLLKATMHLSQRIVARRLHLLGAVKGRILLTSAINNGENGRPCARARNASLEKVAFVERHLLATHT